MNRTVFACLMIALPGALTALAGSVTVVDTLASQEDVRLIGGEPGDGLGQQLASGDFNNDGLADLAALARGADGPANARTDAGEVYIYLGRTESPGSAFDVAGLLGPLPDVIIYGPASREASLMSTPLRVADFNGDGFDDLAFSHPRSASGEMESRIDLVLGREVASPEIDLAASPLLGGFATLTTPWAPTDLGAGDVNGDGIADLAILDGATLTPASPDAVVLVFGSDPLAVAQEVPTDGGCLIEAPPGRAISEISRTLRDVTGDGLGDVVVSTLETGSSPSRPLAGEVHIVQGRSVWPSLITLSESPLEEGQTTVLGAESFDLLGLMSREDSAGDLDGDGLADLLLETRSPSRPWKGYVLAGGLELPPVVDLASSPELIRYTCPEGDALVGGGIQVADVNLDGLNDLVHVAPRLPAVVGDDVFAGGAVIVLTDPDRTTPVNVSSEADGVLLGSTAGHQLGINGSHGVGDMNGDGWPDICLGTVLGESASAERGICGELLLFLGRNALPPLRSRDALEMDVVMFGQRAGEQFAGGPPIVADFNGDGLGDLAVAASQSGGPGGTRPGCGEAYVVLGTPLEPEGITGYAFQAGP